LNTLVQYTADYYHSVQISEAEWYALYVRSKHEFIVHEGLLRKNIETFLPAVPVQKHWKDRRKIINFPLFPGYLFVHINHDPEKLVNVLKTTGAVRILSSENGNPIPVPTEEIYSLRTMIENGQDIDVYPRLIEGARIRIKTGPLRGIEGVLQMKGPEYMCIVNVEILGRSVGIRIYADDLEVL
jgi:transcription antitermination factor NusG